jgi:hypothetical protein
MSTKRKGMHLSLFFLWEGEVLRRIGSNVPRPSEGQTEGGVND